MELMTAIERCRKWLMETCLSHNDGSPIGGPELHVQLTLIDKLCDLIEGATAITVDGNQYLKDATTGHWSTNHDGVRVTGECLLSMVLWVSREKQEAASK